jgi:hypothetical protein
MTVRSAVAQALQQDSKRVRPIMRQNDRRLRDSVGRLHHKITRGQVERRPRSAHISNILLS